MKILFMSLILILAFNSYSVNLNKCLLADIVAEKFSLDIANNRIDDAWKKFNKENLNKKEFIKNVKKVLLGYSGKEVYHSFSFWGLNNGECYRHPDGRYYFKDSRVVTRIGFKMKNTEILPIEMILKTHKVHGWQVESFSTFCF